MICHVIVEGETDKILMERLLLPQYREHVDFIVANGSSRAVSIARMMLASRKQPIVLVMDADEYKPDFANERREEIESALRQFGSSRRFHVVLFVPQMESVLLQNDSSRIALTRGQPLSDADRMQAKYEPKEVIKRLAMNQHIPAATLIQNAIDKLDPSVVMSQAPFDELRDFLQSWLAEAA